MQRKIFRYLIPFVFGFILNACSGDSGIPVRLNQNLIRSEVRPSEETYQGWQIGYDRRLDAKEDVRQVGSLASWLQKRTGLSFDIYISGPDENVVDDLCTGKVDFAVIGTVSYLQAHDQCGAHILLRGRNLEGKDTYRAAIVVAPDSSLQTLSDLRGHTFAFGAVNSTQGNLIPRLMFQQVDLTLDDLSAFTYTGSHTATANAVASHRYDAGALQDTLASDLAKRGLVRILALSETYPSSGIVVGPDVPEETAAIVQQALLQLDPTGADAADLYQWQRTEMPLGFVLANDDEYQNLRQIARTIGLLKP